jgi:hypothetical protein
MAMKCQFRKEDGLQCRANAQPENGLCIFHDPAKAAEVKQARRAGGLTRSKLARVLAADVPDIELTSSKDAAGFLANTISQVRRGELDTRVANAVGYLTTILLKALEQSAVEERMLALEVALGLTDSKREVTRNAEQVPQTN